MINVEINGKLVGQCESAGKASSPLFKDVIEPWIEIRGFIASSPSLTDDQKVVLEWLTENIHLGTLPFNQISLLNQSFFNSPIDTSDKYLKAFGDLDS